MFGFGKKKQSFSAPTLQQRDAPIYNPEGYIPPPNLGMDPGMNGAMAMPKDGLGAMGGAMQAGGIGPSSQFQMPGMQPGQIGLPGMPGIAAGRFKPPGMPGMNGKIGLPGMPGINAGRFKMKAPPGLGFLGGLFGKKKQKQPSMPTATAMPKYGPMPGVDNVSGRYIE